MLSLDRCKASCAVVLAGSLVMPAVAAETSNAAHRGGTLRMVANSSAGTLDPQVNYTLQYWQVEQMVYDGLLSYRKASGAPGLELVPDLATEIPAPQDGGKAYVFHLRKGIKFSNGQELTASDVVATFKRIYKMSSPTAGTFFAGIVGAEACNKTPADCTLPGVVGDDAAGTVTFHLTAPDPEFLQKMAVQHSLIVPKSAPDQDVGSTPLPGTGPYRISEYDPNRAMRLVRNPHFRVWSQEAQPDGYPDELVYSFGLNDENQVTAVENGQADWMFEPPPGDRLGEIGSRYPDQVHLSPLTEIYYAEMNNRRPPFDNLKARQAVNFAVDRQAVIKLFGGPQLATSSCQILPPGIAGYHPYCPYTRDPGDRWTAPDMDRAKQLMKESGTAGQSVTVITEDSANARAIGTYLQSVLSELGYKASTRAISPNIEYTFLQNSNNEVQIGLTYWSQDYPAPSDFLNVLFSCDSFHPGSDSSINMSEFCDKDIDAKMHRAMALPAGDPKAADIWAQVDRKITDLAPVAVLFVPKQINFVSKRLGNFVFNAQTFWVASQAWVQ